jgi:prepilin-type N-terminal cleavage/methylation domain-containing protein
VGGRPLREAGFSVTELVVVIALIGVLFTITVPFFLSYYQAAAARANVQEVITLFNQARELAIKRNEFVCVNMPTNTQMAFLLSSCAGTPWTGAAPTRRKHQPTARLHDLAAHQRDLQPIWARRGGTTYTMTNSTTTAKRAPSPSRSPAELRVHRDDPSRA